MPSMPRWSGCVSSTAPLPSSVFTTGACSFSASSVIAGVDPSSATNPSSGSDAKLERAREEFHVGNLYLNRKCTGALVGVHPFGGFNMSGTNAKAGGPDYLAWFLDAKVTSEAIG